MKIQVIEYLPNFQRFSSINQFNFQNNLLRLEHFYYPHVTGKETEAQRLSNLLQNHTTNMWWSQD